MNTRKQLSSLVVCAVLSLLFTQSITANSQAENRSFLPVLARFQAYRESTGVLDLSFGGGDGVVAIDFGLYGVAKDLALQPDGKIVLAGYRFTDGQDYDFALARCHPDGNLDASFGSGGQVITDFGFTELANALALQADGKILVVGNLYDDQKPYEERDGLLLARYNPDGSLDSSFGEQGRVVTDFGSGHYGSDVAIQPDGKIIVTGAAYLQLGEDWVRVFALARYHPDGSLDSTFDGDGLLTSSFSGYDDIAYRLALQPDGKLLVSGRSWTGSEISIVLARYNSDGSLDAMFDGDGFLTVPDLGCSSGYDLALQPDGKIVSAASSCEENVDFILQRFNPDGSPDTAFGEGGRVRTDWGGNEFPMALVLQPDGKIIAAGEVTIYGGGFSFVLARYTPEGSLDTSFGYLGQVLTDISLFDSLGALALQPNGRILLAGSFFDGMQSEFALLRYK